jgi:hypothetical protein
MKRKGVERALNQKNCSRGFATGPLVYNNMPYDAPRDFAPVTLAAVVPYIFVVRPSLPIIRTWPP